MRIQATARHLCSALTERGIAHRVLKGLASAFLDYPAPELRLTGDVDLAVPIDSIDTAFELLGDIGMKPLPWAKPRAKHITKGFTLRSDQGVEIDVHNRLFGRIGEPDVAFADPGIPIPDVTSAALPLELRLVHAAGHLLASPPGSRRMSGLIDTVMLLNADPDPDRTLLWAQRAKVGDLVAQALRVESALTGRPLWNLSSWPAMHPIQRRITLATQRQWGLEYLERMEVLSWRQRVAYLPTWLVPRRDAARKAWRDIGPAKR